MDVPRDFGEFFAVWPKVCYNSHTEEIGVYGYVFLIQDSGGATGSTIGVEDRRKDENKRKNKSVFYR